MLEDGSWKTGAGRRELEDGSWKTEAGRWKTDSEKEEKIFSTLIFEFWALNFELKTFRILAQI